MRYHLLTFSLLLSSFVQAQVIHVPDDLPTIQEALDAADAGDTVFVAPGVYFENIVWPAVNGIKMIAEGDTSDTFIDGNFEDRVIHIQGSLIDTLTEIVGFTIQHGRGTGTFAGSGIFCDSAGVTIRESRITRNIGHNGVGICFRSSVSVVENTSVDENMFQTGGVSMASGIGIFCSRSWLTIRDSRVNYNYASECWKVFGAGIGGQESDVSILNCEVSGNTADVKITGESRGVGVFMHRVNLTMRNCSISNNLSQSSAKFNWGTAINVESGFSVLMENVTINGNESAGVEEGSSSLISINSATSYLKGINITDNILECGPTTTNADCSIIHVLGTGPFVADDLLIRDNLVRTNLGIFSSHGMVMRFQHGSIELTNLAVINNQVSEFQEGNMFQSLITFVGNGTASITNATIADNHGQSAGLASAIESESSPVTIKNSIVWNSSALSQVIGESVTVTFSDVLGGHEGEGNIDFEPNFMGEGDYRLQFPSPCIGTGTIEGAPEADILGNPRPRPIGTNPDMGAYEDDHPFTSVHEVRGSDDFRIYPNPTAGVVNWEVNIAGSSIPSVEVTDVQGRKVLDTLPRGGSTSIDLSELPSGVYSLRLILDDRSSAFSKVVLMK